MRDPVTRLCPNANEPGFDVVDTNNACHEGKYGDADNKIGCDACDYLDTYCTEDCELLITQCPDRRIGNVVKLKFTYEIK